MTLIDKQQAYDVLTSYYHHTTDTQHEALRDALNRVPTIPNDMVSADRVKKLAVIESVTMEEPVKSVLPLAVAWIVDKALEET